MKKKAQKSAFFLEVCTFGAILEGVEVFRLQNLVGVVWYLKSFIFAEGSMQKILIF